MQLVRPALVTCHDVPRISGLIFSNARICARPLADARAVIGSLPCRANPASRAGRRLSNHRSGHGGGWSRGPSKPSATLRQRVKPSCRHCHGGRLAAAPDLQMKKISCVLADASRAQRGCRWSANCGSMRTGREGSAIRQNRLLADDARSGSPRRSIRPCVRTSTKTDAGSDLSPLPHIRHRHVVDDDDARKPPLL